MDEKFAPFIERNFSHMRKVRLIRFCFMRAFHEMSTYRSAGFCEFAVHD